MDSQQLKKDIFWLFIFQIGNALYFSYNVLYPYTYSYLKHFDDTLEVKYFLFNILGIYFGFIIGTFIIPYFFYLFSIKGTMIFTSFAHLTHLFVYASVKSYWWNLAMTTSIGVLFEFQNYSVNYYLSSKYKDGILYSGYVFLGQNLNMIYFPLFFQYMMNPLNKTMDQISYGSGSKEVFFSWEISKNFPFVMRLVGLISFVCHILACAKIENPENVKAQFKEFFKVLLSGKKDQINQLRRKISETSQNMYTEEDSVIKRKQIQEEQDAQQNQLLNLENRQQKQISESEAQNYSIKALKHQKVLLLVLIMASINGSLLYFINFLKIPVLLVLKDDQKFSICLTLSAIFSLSGKIVPGLLWNRFGFYKCYFLFIFLGWIQFIIAFYFRYKNFYFVFLYLTLTRFLLAMKFILIYNLLYKKLNPKIANYISKIFECNYIIGVGSWLTYNNIFFDFNNLYQNINVLLIVTSVTLIVFLCNYKNFDMIKIIYN